MVCHTGIISSFTKSGIVDMIQIDASVNSSNSGGPLIDPKTEKVIGIITRKAAGLTKVFSELRSILQENIKLLSETLILEEINLKKLNLRNTSLRVNKENLLFILLIKYLKTKKIKYYN